MNVLLSPDEHRKLVRVLELVARSDLPGEVMSAAHATRRILAGRTVAEVWPAPRIGYTPPEQARPEPPTWRDRVEECRQRPSLLTEWERQFVESLARRSMSPTPKQAFTLAEIISKVRARR